MKRPLVLAASLLTFVAFVHPASAATDVAGFAGGFETGCSLPTGPEGPVPGPYTCHHAAHSMSCVGVTDTGVDVSVARTCRADLVSGSTAGTATPSTTWTDWWTCDSGHGTGTFEYQPWTAESAVFTIPVSLDLDAENQVIEVFGTYLQVSTQRRIVVRAQLPATCTYGVALPVGYHGAVTPA